MFKKDHLNFLCCPDCRGDLNLKNKTLTCSLCTATYPIKGSIPILLPSSMTGDVKLSLEKWDEEYKKTKNKKELFDLRNNFRKIYLEANMKHLNKIYPTYKNKKYLEIGCGPFFTGQEIANKGSFVVGIDYSLNALRLAKFYLDEEKITNYLLVCGDITKMPFMENTFDLLYGGGVIEHFKDTVGVVKENHRVIKSGGTSFNTVPYLNLGALTYRQAWGNIPNTPILKELAEFVHIKILHGKRMIYGYEYSFTKGQLRNIFEKAKFKKSNIQIEKLEVPLLFEYLKIKYIRRFAILITNRTELFWPVLYILAKK